MATFSYIAPAELFIPRTFRKNGAITYERFDTAAEAIRHAIEALEPTVLKATVLEADEERYDAVAIRELYDSDAFPLARTTK